MIHRAVNSPLCETETERGLREREVSRREVEREINPVKPMNARRTPITELLLRAVYTGATATASGTANCFNRPYLTNVAQ